MNLLQLPLWLRLTATFGLGAIVGSFLNVCIYRLPWGQSVIRPGSRCPRCGSPIRWYDNIPLVSWFVLGGRCRSCAGPISPRYLAVELLTATLFALLYWLEVEKSCLAVQWGPVIPQGAAGAWLLHLRYLDHCFLLCAMIAASFIDLDHQIIPDPITLPGMFVGLAVGFAVGQVHLIAVWIQPPAFALPNQVPFIPPWFVRHPHLHGLIASLAGLVVGGATVWIVRIVGRLALGKEAMGFGDVTLLAMIGSFVGWQAVLCVFFAAPIFALLVGLVQWIVRGQTVLPYGPYLCLATLGVLLGWRSVWDWLQFRLFLLLGLGWWWLLGLAAFGIALLGALLVAVRFVGGLAARQEVLDDARNGESPGAEEPGSSPPSSGPPADNGGHENRD